MKRLLSPELKAAQSVFYFIEGINEEEGDVTNRDLRLEVLIDELLARHQITIKEYDPERDENIHEFNIKDRTIATVPREQWRYCEHYFVQVLICISAFRRGQVDGTKYYKRTVLKRVADAVVAYRILDYLQYTRPMHEVYIAKHFHEEGGHYYSQADSWDYGSGLELEVNKQLNLIINYKGSHLNFHGYSKADFIKDFDMGLPYLAKPGPQQEDALDRYRDAHDFDILDGIYGR